MERTDSVNSSLSMETIEDDANGLDGYSKHFSLTTADFTKRVLRSFLPVKPLLGYEEDGENHRPDLYGPIWVPTTLVLSLSMGHSLYNFFRALANKGNVPVSSYSGLDFRTLWISAVLVYGYCLILPVSLFVVKLCSSIDVRFFHTLCVYGYSMCPIVVASFICTVPVRIVQWSAMGGAFFLSTLFMLYNLWREQTVEARSLAYFVKLISSCLHAALGVAIIFLFF